MKQSEKIMAGAIACLVPIGVFFMGYVWYANQHDLRKGRISYIEKEIQNQQLKQLEALSANRRRDYIYRRKSLPADHAKASVLYRDWLSGTLDDCKLNAPSISAPEKSLIRFNDGQMSVVANRYRFSITARGTLDEIIRFCYAFEQVDLLQKISDLTILPIRQKDELTGEHSVTMKIEILSLLDADEERDFLTTTQPLETDIAAYNDSILTRNIFGLANNPPKLRVGNKEYEVGDDFSISLRATDDDRANKLTYAIVDDGGMEGLEIIADERTAKLNGDAKEIGEYKIVISVTDNGFPQKSDTDDFKIKVTPEKVAEAPPKKPEPPPEPPFKFATKTQIKKISSRQSGDEDPVFTVRIDAMPLGKTFNLVEKDTFELDDLTWVVKQIDVHTLTLVVDGKEREYRYGDFLSEPRNETVLEPVEPAEVSKVTD